MTNHKRSLGSGVAGPLIASLSALVLLVGISWFVLRDTGDRKPTGQANPVTSVTTASDDAPLTTPVTPIRPTSPSVTPRRTTPTPTPTRSKTKSPTPTPTRSSTQPSRDGTRTPKPSPRPTRTTTTSKPPTTKPGGGSGTAEAQVLALTNQERAKAGCGALRTNSALTNAAEAHAADMVDKHYFAHDSQDGRSPFDRMKAAGFKGGAMAENIAVGYSSAAAVVKGWMNSPGHRQNILNCSYTMIGIGYDSGQVKPEWGNGSWVQDFGG
ncbi:CAP domain-containing protein [Kribbella sp. NPDC026596]|uniref:CAP domain-containing protein n=1 Tax=Kribbella sp. NPDC026596 TaxID=3155122 RepID=UPI0033C7F6CE